MDRPPGGVAVARRNSGRWSVTLVLAAAAAFGACGGGDGGGCDPTNPICGGGGGGGNPVPTTITVEPTSLSFSSVGETGQLTATVKDQNGATMSGQTVTWTSSAAAIATVSGTGLVTAVASGTASITATSGSLSASATVSVNQVAASVDVSSPVDSVMAVGRTVPMAALVKDASGNAIGGATVSWSSSSPVVATVDGSGVVTGVSAGTTTVTATSGSLSGTYVMRVTPSDLDGISGLLTETFVTALSSVLTSATRTSLTGLVSQCAGYIADGNVLGVSSCLSAALGLNPTNGTETAVLAVMDLFFEQAERKLQLGR